MHGLTLQLTMEVINTACVMVVAAFFIIRADEQLLEAGRQTSARTLLKLSLIFGAFSLYAAFNAIHAFDAVISLRHTGAIVGGFIAGPWVGLGAGLLGAIDRYLQGGPSAYSAVLAVILAGTLAGLYLRYVNRNRLPGVGEAAFFTALYELVAGYLTLLFVPDFTRAWQIESGIRVPLVLGNAIAVGLFIGCVKILAHERDLRQARERAEAANRAKSDFLARISHEIRNPLNLVLGQAQLLAREPLAARQRAMVRRIHDAGDSLLFILNDLLDLAKIEAGHLILQPRPCDLAGLMARLAELMVPLAQAKGLTLRVIGPPPGERPLSLDEYRLKQVLTNLIHNAIKFTDQGEVVVRVQTQRLNETQVRLSGEVWDTGSGIAPEDLPLIFTPFFTQDDPGVSSGISTGISSGVSMRINDPRGGTGLGLAICKWLVELMGGEIGVRNQPGRGATFWFELTCEIASTAENAAAADNPGAMGAAEDAGRAGDGAIAEDEPSALAACHPGAGNCLLGAHILVVDDSEENLEVVDQALRLEGAQVTLAHNGREALNRLLAAPTSFTAVLMDLRMPVMDGLSATRLIRAQPALATLPIIALTANALHAHRQAALAAGMDDVLTKPFDLDLMVALLRQWSEPRLTRGPADGVELERDNAGGVARGIAEGVAGAVTVDEGGARGGTRGMAGGVVRGLSGAEAEPVDEGGAGSTGGETDPVVAAPVASRAVAAPVTSFPYIPGLDREQAAKALCGNEAMFLDFLQRFATRYGNLVPEVREGLARGEREAAVGRLHQLRGFAANLGAEGVTRHARILEETIRRGADPAEGDLAELDDQIRIVIDASAPWRQPLG